MMTEWKRERNFKENKRLEKKGKGKEVIDQMLNNCKYNL